MPIQTEDGRRKNPVDLLRQVVLKHFLSETNYTESTVDNFHWPFQRRGPFKPLRYDQRYVFTDGDEDEILSRVEFEHFTSYGYARCSHPNALKLSMIAAAEGMLSSIRDFSSAVSFDSKVSNFQISK